MRTNDIEAPKAFGASISLMRAIQIQNEAIALQLHECVGKMNVNARISKGWQSLWRKRMPRRSLSLLRSKSIPILT